MQKAAATVDDTQFLPGFVRAIECVPVGSRVVALVDSADAFGTTGSSDSAVKADEDVVIVADILSITPDRATGEPQPEVEGMPKVTLDDDGRPTVTIPDTEAPKDLKLAVLKQGDGEEVQEGDTVSVQYQGTNWTTGKVFDESWGKQIASFQTTGVVKGFSQALVGQKVGSQVLVVIPPALGYGDAGQPSAGIGGTDDLVFVIDILQTSR
jgi:peptidylprolyl isomerase